MQELYTNRLILREWKPSDAVDMFEYARDPEIGPNAGWAPHKDIEESCRVIEMFRESRDEIYAMVLREDGRVIGSIGLHERSPSEVVPSGRSREIGYVLTKKLWGKGLVPEACARLIVHAFKDMAVDELWCGHYSFNERSRSVVLKTGFRYVETVRKTLDRLDGREVDLLAYRITRGDFEELQKDLLERAGIIL
ncbi:GNAT family N-acetyltransferase [Youngiibacter multivorans]|uniref:RimJ/RimL family protein N-acetyltransferase n=1 Tax=Youngiibacter multivorans TaxID=937251 RepID=A0ABS4G552_9CLOT|nr:GNAT family N-acetyltransferase [Youngiibacter multivorans]MBP1919690.1 RimJ/RimL family protein N-acetyltransferase [Youngiibacter multivorans]